MPTCYHWGAPDGADCRDVSTEVVYEDPNGHHYCLLHSPKYYVAPKGFFIGEREGYSPRATQISKEDFDKNLKTLINNQRSSPDIRFDNIYFPENYLNSFDQYNEPTRRFSFYRCYNISSFSNSSLKAIRINNCVMNGLYTHNLKVEEFSISSSEVKKIQSLGIAISTHYL